MFAKCWPGKQQGAIQVGGQAEPQSLHCHACPGAVMQPHHKAAKWELGFSAPSSLVQHLLWHQGMLPSWSPSCFKSSCLNTGEKKNQMRFRPWPPSLLSSIHSSLTFPPHWCQKTAASFHLDPQQDAIAAGLEGAACSLPWSCTARSHGPTKAHLVQTTRALPHPQLPPVPDWFLCFFLSEGKTKV